MALPLQLLTEPQDLISYVIESVDPFTVRECVKGDGKFAMEYTTHKVAKYLRGSLRRHVPGREFSQTDQTQGHSSIVGQRQQSQREEVSQ